MKHQRNTIVTPSSNSVEPHSDPKDQTESGTVPVDYRDLLAVAAHEFRSPLQNIIGQLTVLRTRVPQNPEILEIVDRVLEEALRAKQQLANVLTDVGELSYTFGRCDLRPYLSLASVRSIQDAHVRCVRCWPRLGLWRSSGQGCGREGREEEDRRFGSQGISR
ncbi:MAG: hypothetical protein FJ279_01335 [Planctomycetes bacterium]|nr:hypothetical protein [Planctomycetota bacterium]